MKNRIYGLDWLRVIAAISVVLYHYTTKISYPNGLPEYLSIFKYGFFGVEVFFVISGFVILMSAQNTTWQKFAKSRVLRIYPTLWICGTITALTYIILSPETSKVTWFQFLSNMTLLHRQVGQDHLDGSYWSLTVELRFYIFIGIFIYFNKLNKLKTFLIIWLVLSGLSILFQHNPSRLLYWGPYFISGTFFYYTYKNRQQKINRLILLSSIVLCLLQARLRAIDNNVDILISISIIAISFIIFAFVIYKKPTTPPNAIIIKISIRLGLMTYPLYLVHQDAGVILINKLPKQISEIDKIWIVLSTMVFLAYIITKYLEPLLTSTITRSKIK